MAHKGKIVVIDDSPIVLEWVRRCLSAAGYEVLTQDQPLGSGALILREQPDLVLLDLSMPALSGEDLLHTIRRRESLRKTPVLLFSSRDDEELRRIQNQTGADGFIRKMADARAFVAEVDAWMDLGVRARGLMRTRKGEVPEPLFVDDDERILNAYRRSFVHKLGGEYVSDPDAARDRILSAKPPKVVVADVHLGGPSGLDLYDEAMRCDPSWRHRFLFITGRPFVEPEASRLRGVEAPVLNKPVDQDLLTSLVLSLAGR